MTFLKKIIFLINILLVGVNFAQINSSSSSENSISNYQIIKEKFDLILNKQTNDIESMLDSAIVVGEDGSKEKHLYSYSQNSFNNWASYKHLQWDGNSWQNYMRMSYNYDNNGYLLGGNGQIWKNNQWENMLRYTISYNNNLIAGSIEEMWLNDNWTTTSQSTITYDEVNNSSTEISQGSFFGFSFHNKEIIKYDINDNIISIEISEFTNDDWIKTEFTTYDYNNNGYKTLEQLQIWNESDEWENSLAIDYSYDENNNRISEISQLWNGSNWINSAKTIIEFNSNNYMTKNTILMWNGTEWTNSKRKIYVYSEEGNMFNGKSELWEFDNWEISEGEFHFFDTKGWYTEYEGHGQSYLFDGTEIIAYFGNTLTKVQKTDYTISEFSLNQNYPNPFNPSTSISFNLPKQTKVKITIYNSLGEEKIELLNNELNAGIHNVKFNAGNFSSGVYFYRITTDNFIDTKRMILLK